MWKWFQRYIPDDKTVENSNIPKRYKKYLQNSALWQINCSSVARGVAVGLFTAMVPILPFQTIMAILLCILISANLPIAILVSWVSNPLTIFPLIYFTYFVGELVMSETHKEVVYQKFLWKSGNFSDFWLSIHTWILQFGKSFFVGLPFVAFGAAALGYFLVIIVWQSSKFIKYYYRKKTKQ